MIQYQADRLERLDDLANKNTIKAIENQKSLGFIDRPMIQSGPKVKAIKQDPDSSINLKLILIKILYFFNNTKNVQKKS